MNASTVDGFNPYRITRDGVDWETLHALNPRLIYANIHAFGDTGPMAPKPGYDPLMQAFAGLMTVTGEPGRPSMPCGSWT